MTVVVTSFNGDYLTASASTIFQDPENGIGLAMISRGSKV